MEFTILIKGSLEAWSRRAPGNALRKLVFFEKWLYFLGCRSVKPWEVE